MGQETSFRDIQVRSNEIGIRKIGLNDLWQSLREGFDDFDARPALEVPAVGTYYELRPRQP